MGTEGSPVGDAGAERCTRVCELLFHIMGGLTPIVNAFSLHTVQRRHWFRLMADPREQFCWTSRQCRVMLLRRETSLSSRGDYDIDPKAMPLVERFVNS